jgi:lactoylglutathione lyase
LEVGLARRGVVERRLRAGIEHDSAIDEDASQEIGERSSMPGQAVPVRGLFESHLTVTDLRRSVAFYRDVVGLPLALEAPERGAAFFWCGTRGKTMLGLWSLGSMPMGLSLHIAFDVNLDHVLDSPRRLTALGVTPLSFFGEETDEPTVIGWMPAATVYFRDPDGHLLEYLAMLDATPRADLGIIPWSEWNRKASAPAPPGADGDAK